MAWNVIQSNLGALDPGVVSATYLSNVSAGTKLIAYITCGGGNNPEVTAIKDAALNSMTKLVSVFNNATAASGELSIWAMDTPAGDVGTKPTLTATATGGNQSYGLVIQEVSGLAAGNTTAMLDGGAFVTKTGTIAANGPLTANAYSSGSANEFLVFVGADSEASIITWGVPTGSTTYTRDAHAGNASNIFNCVPCYGNSTGGAETASSALTGVTATSAYATVIGAFLLAGGGAATIPATQNRPSKSRIYHHHGTRRQQVQAVFAQQAPAVNAPAGLATATATACGPAAALGTVTGFTSVPGTAVPGLFTPGTPEFPGTAATAQRATATGAAQPTAFDYAPAGLATAAGGAPLYGTYTALYTATYGEQLTTVSTVPVANAPAQIATATGVAQQTAGHNAVLAAGTGSAPPSGMAQAQLATGAGIAQQTAGHNVTVAAGTGVAQQTAGHNVTIATGIGDAPEIGMGMAGLAAATGAAQQTAGHNAQTATGTGSAQQPAGHKAQLASAAGAALQATVSTSTGPKKAIGVTVAPTRITGIGDGKNTSTVPTVQTSATGLKLVVASETRATPGAAQTLGSMNSVVTTKRNAIDITTTDTSGSLNAAATTGEGGP